MRKKKIREKGKINLSQEFQELKKGDRVGVDIELGLKINFPKKLQGRAGVIEDKRGRAYIVKIKDLNRVKKYIIKPIHLKKLK